MAEKKCALCGNVALGWAAAERYMAERDAAQFATDVARDIAERCAGRVTQAEQECDAAQAEAELQKRERTRAETELRRADARALELRREVDKWIGAAEDAGTEANGLAVQLDAALAEAKRFEALMVRRDAELDAERGKEWNVLAAQAEAAGLREALECIRSHHTFEDWRVALELSNKALATDATDAGKLTALRLEHLEGMYRAASERAEKAERALAIALATAEWGRGSAALAAVAKAERERDNWKAEAEWTDRLRTQALTEMKERCAAEAWECSSGEIAAEHIRAPPLDDNDMPVGEPVGMKEGM